MSETQKEREAWERARADLLEAEIRLKDQVKEVAALRAKLPQGVPCEDYALLEGPSDHGAAMDTPRTVRLSELFERKDQPLTMIQFMFGGSQTNPCPMCSMWADGYNAVARHLSERTNLVLCVEGDLAEFRAWASKRGWGGLRIVSSAGSSLKDDLAMQTPEGGQLPGISVFTNDDGLRHYYSVRAMMGGNHYNGVDLMSPVWHMLDLLPGGRGDFMPSLEYSG